MRRGPAGAPVFALASGAFVLAGGVVFVFAWSEEPDESDEEEYEGEEFMAPDKRWHRLVSTDVINLSIFKF